MRAYGPRLYELTPASRAVVQKLPVRFKPRPNPGAALSAGEVCWRRGQQFAWRAAVRVLQTEAYRGDRGGGYRKPDQARAVTVMRVRQHAADEGIGEQGERSPCGELAQIASSSLGASRAGSRRSEAAAWGKRDRLMDAVDRREIRSRRVAGGRRACRRPARGDISRSPSRCARSSSPRLRRCAIRVS